MKSRAFLLISLFGLLCSGCVTKNPVDHEVPDVPNESNNQTPDEPNNKIPDEPVVEVYDEELDSIEGIDVNDISGLLECTISSSISECVTQNRQFFNEDASKYYKINYGVEPMEEKTFYYSSRRNDTFTLFDFDWNYIQNHTFTRISKHKYECKDSDAIQDFINVIVPKFQNEGHFMTFSRITIELLKDYTVRYRLYCQPTQIGKLIETHQDTNKPNWYLLFAECKKDVLFID